MSELTAAELQTAPTEVEIAEVLAGLSGPAEYQYAHKIVRRMAMYIYRLLSERDAALATDVRYKWIATVAVERCRNERGPCWCGCHATEMIDETKVLANGGPTE